jgi:PTS system fructose-specific IIC component
MIGKFLEERNVIMHLKAEGKVAALSEILDRVFGEVGSLTDFYDRTLSRLCDREEQASTGVGSGIALPHAATEALQEGEMLVSVARSVRGIPYESIDGMPAHILVAILYPETYTNNRLRLISEISSVLGKEENRERIMSASDELGIIEVFTEEVKPV